MYYVIPREDAEALTLGFYPTEEEAREGVAHSGRDYVILRPEALMKQEGGSWQHVEARYMAFPRQLWVGGDWLTQRAGNLYSAIELGKRAGRDFAVVSLA